MIQTLSKDPILKKLIEQFGILELNDNHMRTSKDLFFDLTSAIVRQQLSNKGGETLVNRLIQLFNNDITADRILSTAEKDLRTIGLSGRKISYLQSLATAVQSGSLQLEKLEELSDSEVIAELIKIKGIGQWTAEMFLLFSLQRADVFSMGDFGIKKAMQQLYGNGSILNVAQMEEISQKWRPYRSYA